MRISIKSCIYIELRKTFLKQNEKRPTLSDLEGAFSVEKVSKQVYLQYRELYENLKEERGDTKQIV